MCSREVYKKILDLLDEAYVCRRCVLRFFGDRGYTNYASKSKAEKAIQSFLDIDGGIEDKADSNDSQDPISQSAKRFMASTCAACLGIIQDACDVMPQKIEEVVKNSGHIFKEFLIQVSLPVCIDLRDKLIFCYLKEHLSDSYKVEEKSIPSVKDICKWIIGPQYSTLKGIDFTPLSKFQIHISSSYTDTAKECAILYQKSPNSFPNAQKHNYQEKDVYTKAAILKAINVLSLQLSCLYNLPPVSPDKPCVFEEVVCSHLPLHIGGRYNKYSRELSQTPWILDGERKMESSVNELITDVVLKHFICDKMVFSASGREDVDVMMLGNGRPFVLEVFNPRRIDWTLDEMEEIENEINKSTNLISVKSFQVILKEDLTLLKEGEELKKKTYSALCIVEKTLTKADVHLLENVKDLVLLQKTPLRVLHRRSLSTREKTLHSIQASIIDDHHLRMKVVTQAGTYVKEFVHSDFGRTNPNIGSLLGTKADILELDVENIDLDWPPKKVPEDNGVKC